MRHSVICVTSTRLLKEATPTQPSLIVAWLCIADNLKLTFPMAIAAGQMAWGLYAGGSGYDAAPMGLTMVQENLQWAANYLSLAQGNNTGYVVQVRRPCQDGFTAWPSA